MSTKMMGVGGKDALGKATPLAMDSSGNVRVSGVYQEIYSTYDTELRSNITLVTGEGLITGESHNTQIVLRGDGENSSVVRTTNKIKLPPSGWVAIHSVSPTAKDLYVAYLETETTNLASISVQAVRVTSSSDSSGLFGVNTSSFTHKSSGYLYLFSKSIVSIRGLFLTSAFSPLIDVDNRLTLSDDRGNDVFAKATRDGRLKVSGEGDLLYSSADHDLRYRDNFIDAVGDGINTTGRSPYGLILNGESGGNYSLIRTVNFVDIPRSGWLIITTSGTLPEGLRVLLSSAPLTEFSPSLSTLSFTKSADKKDTYAVDVNQFLHKLGSYLYFYLDDGRVQITSIYFSDEFTPVVSQAETYSEIAHPNSFVNRKVEPHPDNYKGLLAELAHRVNIYSSKYKKHVKSLMVDDTLLHDSNLVKKSSGEDVYSGNGLLSCVASQDSLLCSISGGSFQLVRRGSVSNPTIESGLGSAFQRIVVPTVSGYIIYGYGAIVLLDLDGNITLEKDFKTPTNIVYSDHVNESQRALGDSYDFGTLSAEAYYYDGNNLLWIKTRATTLFAINLDNGEIHYIERLSTGYLADTYSLIGTNDMPIFGGEFIVKGNMVYGINYQAKPFMYDLEEYKNSYLSNSIVQEYTKDGLDILDATKFGQYRNIAINVSKDGFVSTSLINNNKLIETTLTGEITNVFDVVKYLQNGNITNLHVDERNDLNISSSKGFLQVSLDKELSSYKIV